MSHKRVVLDTNVVIALIAGDPEILGLLENKSAVFLAVPALGELYSGAYGSSRVEDNLARLGTLITRLATLACDVETASHYGYLKQQLRAKGRPIPENDLWIAAIARQHELAVMTRDKHFSYVAGVQVDLLPKER